MSGGRTYAAAVLEAPGALPVVRRFPAPTLEPGAVLLRTLYSEVCGTDVHLFHGRLAGVPYPIIPGHVSAGVIEAVAGRVTDMEGSALAEGDMVTFLDVHETCGSCYHCLVARQPTRCPSRKVYGITYGANDGLLGGWAEAIWLKPGVKLVRLPEGLLPETFIGGGCGLVTALHAVERGEVRLGDRVAVLGAGPVGQSMVALAALSGAEQVIAIGGPEDRLRFAESMGATATMSLGVPWPERLADVRALTGGRGADVVLEGTGVPEAVPQALELVRDGGRVVIAGHYTDTGDVAVHPHWHLTRKHVDVRGCWGSEFRHFEGAVRLAARFGGRVPWSGMAERRYCLEDCGEALLAVERQEVLKAVIVPGPAGER